MNRSAGIPASALGNLYADRHGRLYVCEQFGVTIWDGAARMDLDSIHGLPVDAVHAVLVDREESLWLGAFGGGLLRLLGNGEWQSWRKEDGLPHNAIWAIRRDRSGRMWVGTDGGLSLLSPQGGVERSWTTRNGLAGSSVNGIAEEPNGDLFVATEPTGISRFSKQAVFLRTYGSASGLAGDSLFAVAFDAQGRLWVGGSGGCFRSRTPSGADSELKFEHIEVPGLPAQAKIRDLAVEESGAVWIATSHGLARFDSGRWRIFTAKDGLKGEDLESFALEQGSLWLIYRNALGITRLRLDGDRLVTDHFTMQNGLSSDQVYSLALDRAGRPRNSARFLMDSDDSAPISRSKRRIGSPVE